MNFTKINKFKAIGLLSISGMLLHDCDHIKPHQNTGLSQFEGKVLRVHVPFVPESNWTKITPVKVIHYSDGGKAYVYSIGGTTVESPMPPNGFNPLTASKTELDQYGIPTPPSKSQTEAYQQWVQFVSSMDIVDNATQYQTQDHNEIACSECGSESSTNHSGYVVDLTNVQHIPLTNPPTQPYIQKITAEYTQVGAHHTSCPNPAESSWIGFGGIAPADYSTATTAGALPLTQIGSEVNPGGRIVPFYEYISTSDNDSAGISIPITDNVGNKMSVYMAYIPRSNSIAFIISNQSVTYKNGGHPTAVRLLPKSVPAVNSQNHNINDYFFPYGAQVDIEAPVINNYPFYSGVRPMVDFGTEQFTNAEIGWRVNGKVKWKALGASQQSLQSLGIKNATFTRFTGYSTPLPPSSQQFPQVNISSLMPNKYNSFNGKWLHC
jgi:hypothetical protein